MKFEELRPLEAPQINELIEPVGHGHRYYQEYELDELRHNFKTQRIARPMSDSGPEAIAAFQQTYADHMLQVINIEQSGFSVQTIHDYYARLGLATSPIVFREGLSLGKQGPDHGIYVPSDDVATVFVNFTPWAEGTAAHESGHSSATNYLGFAWDEKGLLHFGVERGGFKMRGLGELPNEGRAEILGSEYLRMAHDLSTDSTFTCWGKEYGLPAKYVPRRTHAKVAALGFELLMAAVPETFPLMMHGDGNDEVQADLAASCDELEPGLYSWFMSASGSDFYEFAVHMIDKHFDGDPNATLYASEFCSNLIQQRLT